MSENLKAFPASSFERDMDLRDYFAGQVVGKLLETTVAGPNDAIVRAIAATAYSIADAMLAARSAS